MKQIFVYGSFPFPIVELLAFPRWLAGWLVVAVDVRDSMASFSLFCTDCKTGGVKENKPIQFLLYYIIIYHVK